MLADGRQVLLRKYIFLMLATVLVVSPLCAFAQASLSSQLPQFLKESMKLSDDDLTAVQGGQVVTKQVESKVKQEVAVVSVAWINASREVFLKNYETAKLNVEMAAADVGGMFRQPADVADLQALTVPPNDLKEFNKCMPGACKIKGSEEAIDAFRNLNEKAADYQAQAEALLRQQIVGYIQNYLKNGKAALLEYRDKENPVSVAGEFTDILKRSPYLDTYYPQLKNYLENFPQGEIPQAKTEFYWMIENFGGKANRPTVTASQRIMYQPEGNTETVVATKQLYANHYYEAALGLTFLVDAPDAGKPGFYLVHINRARIDALREVPKMLAGDVFTGAQELLHKKMTTVKERAAQLK